MTTPRVTLKSCILLGERIDPPTSKDGKPWKHDAFDVVLECDGRIIETPWRQGVGHRAPPMGAYNKTSAGGLDGCWISDTSHGNKRLPGKPKTPTAEDVLASLLMDARDVESFEDWCGEYGYDTDSRKALELYLRLQTVARDVRALLRMSAEDAVEKFGGGDSEAAAKALTAEPVEV